MFCFHIIQKKLFGPENIAKNTTTV